MTVHLDGMRAIEVDPQPAIQHDPEQRVIERRDRQRSFVSPDEHSVVPGETPKPKHAALGWRIPPELLFLDHVESQDLHLIACRGEALAHLAAPCFRPSDRGWVALDKVKDLHAVKSW